MAIMGIDIAALPLYLSILMWFRWSHISNSKIVNPICPFFFIEDTPIFYIAATKFRVCTMSAIRDRARGTVQFVAGQRSRATSNSFLLVKGSFRPSRRKTRPRNATNTFAWSLLKLLTTLPATWTRFWPGHRRSSNLVLEGLSHYQIS